MNYELTKLQKDYLKVLTDVDQMLNEIEKSARRFRKKQQTEVFSKKKYPQKKLKIKHLENKKL